MEELLNQKIVTLQLKRIEICDLLIATTHISHEVKADKWSKLHDKLYKILNDFDKENFNGE